MALLLLYFQREHRTLLEHKILQCQKAHLKPRKHLHLHNTILQHTWWTFNIRNPSARTLKYQSSTGYLKLRNLFLFFFKNKLYYLLLGLVQVILVHQLTWGPSFLPYGFYKCCSECSRILDKKQEPEDSLLSEELQKCAVTSTYSQRLKKEYWLNVVSESGTKLLCLHRLSNRPINGYCCATPFHFYLQHYYRQKQKPQESPLLHQTAAQWRTSGSSELLICAPSTYQSFQMSWRANHT